MWYLTRIVVSQNPFFYDQEDGGGNKIANSTEYEKIDRNEYVFIGGLGCVFESVEKRPPRIEKNEHVRYIFGIRFEARSVERVGGLFSRRYRICWTSRELDTYEKIRKFFNEKILPSYGYCKE